MATIVNTHCRCGVELVVAHGGITHCSHCDLPCVTPSKCGFCDHLSRTCTDCRVTFKTVGSRAECERSHGHDR